MERTKEYATRIEGHTFDYPIILEADIIAGKLLPANNKDEAGLPPSSISYLRNIKFTILKNTGITDSVFNALKKFGEVRVSQ